MQTWGSGPGIYMAATVVSTVTSMRPMLGRTDWKKPRQSSTAMPRRSCFPSGTKYALPVLGLSWFLFCESKSCRRLVAVAVSGVACPCTISLLTFL